jgi:hypothetical protein
MHPKRCRIALALWRLGTFELVIEAGFTNYHISRSPRYRIEREASEERAWQQLVNVFRRLAGLRINRTGQQAYDNHPSQAGGAVMNAVARFLVVDPQRSCTRRTVMRLLGRAVDFRFSAD